MFTQLFKPKWEHNDPRIRRKALESGAVPPDVLEKAAREDCEPDVRLCAVEQLQNLNLLAQLAASEPLANIRDAADRRERALLSAPLTDGPALEVRLDVIRRSRSPELCTFLAREAREAEIRAVALEQVADTDLLIGLAVDDPVAAVRRAALERIVEPRGWETVARKARNKDKQISRCAREHLETYRKTCAEQEAAEKLCLSMEGLVDSTVSADTRAAYQRLCAGWNKFESTPPSHLTQRFERAQKQLAENIEHYTSLMNKRNDLCDELETLLRKLKEDQAPVTGTIAAESDPLLEIIKCWEALTPAAAENDTLTTRFAELIKQVRRESDRLRRDEELATQLRAQIEKAKSVLQDPTPPDKRKIKSLKRRWAELKQPQSVRLAQTLQQEFDTHMQALRERLNKHIEDCKQALEEAERFLAELEDGLQQGKLECALSLRDRIRHRLKTSRGVDDARRGALQERLHATHVQLDHLRDWRHWGSAQSRERLCSEMEALADSPLSAVEIANRVRKAREAWKRIDHAEGRADEELWQRFDQACTRAYAPYQEQRREHMVQLETHLERKQSLCAELEAIQSDTDWESVEWNAVDKQINNLRRKWHRIGPVPRKASKALEKRYRDALAQLETHLGKERESELRRRRALIARIEALADAQDPRAASHEVKEAQNSWRPSVQAEPKLEQVLWKQFRDACNTVYQRVNEEREATERERRTNLEQKTALCKELETLLESPDTDIQTITRRFAEVDNIWREIGSIPRKDERAVAQQYEALHTRLAEREQQAANAAAESVLEGTRQRAQLCERLEAEVLEGHVSAEDLVIHLGKTREQWQALAPLDQRYETPMRERLEFANRLLAGDPEVRQGLDSTLEHNLKQRLDLCLQLEIEAGIDSPAEFADTRMRMQVERLEDALTHRQESSRDGGERLRALQIAWLQAGPVPGKEKPALEERYLHAMKTLLQK